MISRGENTIKYILEESGRGNVALPFFFFFWSILLGNVGEKRYLQIEATNAELSVGQQPSP